MSEAEWFDVPKVDAASPAATQTRTSRGARVRLVYQEERRGEVILAATAGTLVTGIAWFSAAYLGVYDQPWSATAAGAFIGFSLAVGARRSPVSLRGTAALVGFLVASSVVLTAQVYTDQKAIYGSVDWRLVEDALIRSVLRDRLQLAALAGGAILAWVVATMRN